MRINKYNTLVNENKLPYLVKESGINYPGKSLNNPESIYTMMKTVFHADKQTEEHLWLLCLDTRNHLIGVFEISHGTVDASLVGPREVFMKSILCGACKIVLIHNHPSGEEYPSQEDIAVTNKIQNCGQLMGISLIDHIIIGDSYYSFMEGGILKHS